MPFLMIREEGRQVLKLQGAVTIRHAQELAATITAELEEGAPVYVDTTELEDIDTCILQLLVSLRKTAPALHFERPSEVLVGIVGRCGLRRELLLGKEDL
jgi:anti-anti-sigma regulatory factor